MHMFKLGAVRVWLEMDFTLLDSFLRHFRHKRSRSWAW